ncbi:helix-turn-helix domain-containing protein [Carnobacterium divergens]|uniref:helix-turn-helix domain-containing protein n=1 Tax=Carnobacterium divergens TaxID=2748 RepID=UPI0007F47BD5|nr:helix-turn-helix domain-containing protein [Carnobacterium divergens]SBO16112.1 putative transcriptional regulator [Carnobacterium divergens]
MIPLFDKGNKSRFLLFKHLLYKNRSCSLIELSHNTAISKNSVLKHIDQIQLDLNTFYPSNELAILKSKEGFRLLNKTQLPTNFLVDQIKLFYLQKSLKYQVLEELIIHGASSVEALSVNLYISIPNTYKKLKELEPILEEFHLTIKFGTKLTSNLIGAEKDIRAFIFYFFWNAYKGIEPFRDCNEIDTTHLKLDYSETILEKHSALNRMSSLITLCSWRIKDKGTLIDLDPEMQLIFQQFSRINDVSPDLEHSIPTLNSTHLEREKLYFNYMARLHVGNLDSPQQKRQIALLLLELDTKLISLSKELLEQFIDYFNLELTFDERLFYFYYVVSLQLYLFYVEIYPEKLMLTPIAIPDTVTNDDYISSISREIKKFCQQFLQTTAFKKEFTFDSHLAPIAHSMFYFLLEFKHSFKLKIYIQYSKKNYGEELIESKIFQLFSREHLDVTSKISEADFIISDSYETNHYDTPLFYIEDIFNPQIWKVLIDKIQQLLFLKSFNK